MSGNIYYIRYEEFKLRTLLFCDHSGRVQHFDVSLHSVRSMVIVIRAQQFYMQSSLSFFRCKDNQLDTEKYVLNHIKKGGRLSNYNTHTQCILK